MSRGSDTRAKLLDAAIELIWTSSYGSVGVEQICERAGVNKGSFYHFFPSKADLAVAAYEEYWQQKRPAYDAMFSSQLPPLERLSRWCACILEGQQQRHQQTGHVCGCPYINIGSELSTQDERLRTKAAELLERGLRYIESAIAEAQRERMISGNDARGLARTVGCAVTGMIVEAKVKNDPAVLAGLEPMVMKLIGAPVPA